MTKRIMDKHPNTPSKPVTVKVAAAELGLSIRTVQFLIKQGRLKAEKLDPDSPTSAYLIERADLDGLKAERGARVKADGHVWGVQ